MLAVLLGARGGGGRHDLPPARVRRRGVIRLGNVVKGKVRVVDLCSCGCGGWGLEGREALGVVSLGGGGHVRLVFCDRGNSVLVQPLQPRLLQQSAVSDAHMGHAIPSLKKQREACLLCSGVVPQEGCKREGVVL